MCSKLPALPRRGARSCSCSLTLSSYTTSRGADGAPAVSPQVRGLREDTMTTDEATKSEGEVQAAALAERGEDITPARDRGVLKVRGDGGGGCREGPASLSAFWGAWSHRWAVSPALGAVVVLPGV